MLAISGLLPLFQKFRAEFRIKTLSQHSAVGAAMQLDKAGIQSSPWIDAGALTPFLHIDASGRPPIVTGTTRGFVGHRIASPGDQRPRGLFAEWEWDGTTLTASVDPLGYFSLFLYVKGREVALSPSILQILAQGADAAPDPVALAVFHRVGFFVEGDTPFRYIRVLPPGGRLTWRDGVLEVKGGPPTPRTLDVTRKQAVEAFIEVPRAVISRFLRTWEGPIALPLSGGRDSRHILLEMAHQRRKPDTCLTFHVGGKVLDAEVQAALAVTARAQIRHTILGRPRMRLRDSVRGLLMTQLCADEHAQMMPLHDYLRGSPAAAIDGIGGDILTNPDDSAADFMERARRGDYDGIARGMIEGHGAVISRPSHHGGAGALFSPHLEAAAVDRLANAIGAFNNAPDPYQAFWFWNRTRREISFVSTAVMGGAAMVFCPYLDPEFVDIGLSLPWAVTSDQQLHNDAIRTAYPQYADIPFASGFRNQPMSRLRMSRFANMLDTIRVAASAGSGGPLASIRGALRPTALGRGAADIYRMHLEFVQSMDANEACRLMALGQRLARAAPTGDKVVTDVHRGD